MKDMFEAREVELKLELPRADAARLRKRSINRLGWSVGVKQHLVSVYYDTRKRSLHKLGLSLRVRSDGERCIQTVKADNTPSAGIFERREWETEIEGDGPDLHAAAGTPVAQALKGKQALKLLTPVFETAVDRTTWRITAEGSEIEVAMDEGRVMAGRFESPIAEIELELKLGSPADLFALAQSLDCAKALKVCVRTKSERGYALAAGDEPNSFKAGPVPLTRGEPAAAAFRTIALACIRHFRLNEPLLIAGRLAEPLHQARVALRRLRSALSLFELVVTDKKYMRLKRRLRDVSRQLGEARNLDVYLANTTLANAGKNRELPSLKLNDARVRAERSLAYGRIIVTLESKSFRRLMQELVGWIEAGPWRTTEDPEKQAARSQMIEDFAAVVLQRRLHRLKRDGRHLERQSPKERHRIRIEAKKLRYACEFFSEILTDRKHRKRYKAFTDALKDLQICLGDLNDIQTGHKIAADLARSEGTPANRSVTVDPAAIHLDKDDKRIVKLLSSAAEARQRLLRAKPFW